MALTAKTPLPLRSTTSLFIAIFSLLFNRKNGWYEFRKDYKTARGKRGSSTPSFLCFITTRRPRIFWGGLIFSFYLFFINGSIFLQPDECLDILEIFRIDSDCTENI